MSRERWMRAYREAPGLFDAFARAEDPRGLIASRLAAAARVAGARVLELGAGAARTGARLAPTCAAYVAVEPEPALLALAAARVVGPRSALVRARAEALPFAAAAFDAVLAGWLFAHLPPAPRARALDEAARVLRPAGRGLFLVESAASGEFQELRRLSGVDPEAELAPLTGELGFEVVDTLATEIAFDDAGEARRVLGYLCGDAVDDELARRPRRRVGHDVVLLRRYA